MAMKQLIVRMREEHTAKLNAYCEAMNVTKTFVIRCALMQYLNAWPVLIKGGEYKFQPIAVHPAKDKK